MSWTIDAIGEVISPCKEKFGLPRQSTLVSELKAKIHILPPFDRDEAFAGLTDFTHIWIVGLFHQTDQSEWQATVRPPRLGGNRRVGVFASRSPCRPNRLSLSVVSLEGIERNRHGLFLDIGGCDLMDGTPVVDIKPYLTYADCITDAGDGYLESVQRPVLMVSFSDAARQACLEIERNKLPGFRVLIERLIAQDPRPAYHADNREYGMRVDAYNVRFQVTGTSALVVSVGFFTGEC